MNLLAISDLHLNPISSERNDQFVRFLEEAHSNRDEILIAGDLFDLWFGWPRVTFEYQKSILRRMQELAADGLAMSYVEGNRDFGIEEYSGKIFRNVATHRLDLTWQNRKVRAVHGDLINSSDRMYRAWRIVSKNPASYFLLRRLPSFLLLRMAEGMERKLKQTNLKHKSYFPGREFERFYREQSAREVDVVVIGHFHLEKEVRVHTDGKDVLFYNLPGWEEGFRYLVIPPGNDKPYFAEWGK